MPADLSDITVMAPPSASVIALEMLQVTGMSQDLSEYTVQIQLKTVTAAEI